MAENYLWDENIRQSVIIILSQLEYLLFKDQGDIWTQMMGLEKVDK